MKRKLFLLTSLLASAALFLAACSGTGTAPAPTLGSQQAPVNTTQPASAPAQASDASAAPTAAPKSAPTFETKSNSAGSVTVDVKPLALAAGEPLAFEIAMNTHSVDLSDDMTKIVILRDDSGKEYKPIAWEGGEPGGHHREGTLKFAPLTSKPKFLELIIKGLARVPERVFKWDVP